MRICHVITGLNVGGAELALCGLLETLGQPEQTVVVLGGTSALSARVERFAELHHLDMTAGRAGPLDFLRLRRLLLTNSIRPDVIHAWMYHANFMSALAAVNAGIPLMWGIHHSLSDLASEKRKTRAVIRMNALLSNLPNRIRYVSAVAAEQHQRAGFSSKHTVVIPNGYDTREFVPDQEARSRIRHELEIPPDALVIGMVARVHPTKDHANFLHAAEHFLATRPDTIFVLVGEGTDDDRGVLDSIERLGLRQRMRLCGRRRDVAALNAAFDIATLSSRGEAFPNALAEAMACGTPCVSTDVGDAMMIVGDTGIIVPTNDHVALSEGWARLTALGDSGRRALGTRARQRITENFGRQAIGRRFIKLYRELIVTQ
ncbi:MAG TPA: glycosyltransferase [Rhodanobacteraceae bacterium]